MDIFDLDQSLIERYEAFARSFSEIRAQESAGLSCGHDPMAVELAKVALRIETVEPGKPLTFLDSNIRCGDPQGWLADVLARLRDHPANKVVELLPLNWKATQQPSQRERVLPRCIATA